MLRVMIVEGARDKYVGRLAQIPVYIRCNLKRDPKGDEITTPDLGKV